MRYADAYAKLLELEGTKFTDYAFDKGGATAYGVTQTAYTNYRLKMGYGQQSVSLITNAEAYDLYYKEYWLPSKAYLLPDGVDFALFQAYVNAGPKAVKWLQQVVGTTQDSVIGPNTLAAVSAYAAKNGTAALVDSFLAIQKEHYDTRVKEDATQVANYNGWLNRISRTYGFISDSLTSAGQVVASAASSVASYVTKNPGTTALAFVIPAILFFYHPSLQEKAG